MVAAIMIGCFVHGARAGVDTPTMSGNSLTWVQIGITQNVASNRTLSLFAADGTGATTGVTTIDFGGNTETGCIAEFFQVTGADLRGGVAAAFVQTATANGTATSGSVTLAAAGNPNNRPIAAFYHGTSETAVVRANWTLIDVLFGTSHARSVISQWRADAFETTASATWATSSAWVGFAAEIKALLVGPPLRVSPLYVWKKWR